MSGRSTAVFLLGIAISAVCLWLVGGSIDLATTVDYLRGANLAMIGLAVAIISVQVVVRAFRWSILLEPAAHVPIPRLLSPLLVGYLGNAVLPARLGEAIRATLVARRERIDIAQSLGTVLLERLIDVAALALLASAVAIALDAPTWIQQVSLITAVATGSLVVALALGGTQWLIGLLDRAGMSKVSGPRRAADRVAAALDGSHRRRSFAIAGGISLGAWCMDAAVFWLVALALGIEIGPLGAVLIGAITILGTAIPAAPGYVGTFELAASAVAVALGVPSDAAVAYALMAHAVTVLPVAAMGAVALLSLGSSLRDVARDAQSARNSPAATAQS